MSKSNKPELLISKVKLTSVSKKNEAGPVVKKDFTTNMITATQQAVASKGPEDEADPINFAAQDQFTATKETF